MRGPSAAIRPGGPETPLDALFRIYSMTKPIVSVAAMTLVEEGRLFLTDPVSKHLPAFQATTVGLTRAAMRREITVHDLMRHTSGLCYGFTGTSPVQREVHAADLINSARDPEEAMEAIASLPLMHQPGTAWEYGLSTDVLGRVVEIVAGASLGEVLRERILNPLGMTDTAFFTPPEKVAPPRRAARLRHARRGGRRPHEPHRAAALRDGGNRPHLDAGRLRALLRDALARRRAVLSGSARWR